MEKIDRKQKDVIRTIDSTIPFGEEGKILTTASNEDTVNIHNIPHKKGSNKQNK